MEKWFVSMKKADFTQIAEKYHISPIIARLIRNRDILGDQNIDYYLNGTIADLHDGMLMKNMDTAVEILEEKIREGEKIRVIGDYDIDGVNATYILKTGLESLGALVDTDIPDRMKDGYGLNQMLIDRALEDGVDTIITCDNGIAAASEIAYGKAQGMTIIVTDHHEVPYLEAGGEKEYLIPDADAVVNPHLPGDPYPFKGLCGAAVVYKVVEALYNVMGQDADDVDFLMENVAIATVGDVMDLVDENRIFVKQGLEMLKRTQNEGLKALMECTQVPIERLSAYHIGFVIGPCINASGRLDTAKRALELLKTTDYEKALVRAAELKTLNDERKSMTDDGVQQALDQIENSDMKRDRVLVIYLPDCHESLAGIIAGRIRERYYRPVFVLTRSQDGVKGSGRSIETYSMFEEMSKCKELYTKYGGHPMAAGVSMPEEHVEKFRKRLNELCTLTEKDLTEVVRIDIAMPFSYVSERLVEELSLLEPFGKGNSKPVFAAKGVQVLETRVLGKNQNVLRLKLKAESGTTMDGIYFSDQVNEVLKTMQQKPRLAFLYYPEINEFRGQRTLQLRILDYC